VNSKLPQDLGKARQAQRNYAKKRLSDRFQLDVNRDQIHELASKIIAGQALRVESKADNSRQSS
jgi:hypothetical protein